MGTAPLILMKGKDCFLYELLLGLEGEVGTDAYEERQLIDSLECDTVEIEDVVSVVGISDAEVEVEDAARTEGELALHSQVESMIVGESSAIEFTVMYTKGTILCPVAGVDAVVETYVLVDA